MPSYKNLLPGDPAPWFQARATSRPDFAFDTAAGRYLVLCFFATAADARGRAAVGAALALKPFFDDVFASFFGVTIAQTDEAQKRLASCLPQHGHARLNPRPQRFVCLFSPPRPYHRRAVPLTANF